MNYKNNDMRALDEVANKKLPSDDYGRLVETWLAILRQQEPTIRACVLGLDGVSSFFEWRQNNDGSSAIINLDNLYAVVRLARRSAQPITAHDKHHLTIANKIPSATGATSAIGSYAIVCDAPSNKQREIQTKLEQGIGWFAHLFTRFRQHEFEQTDGVPWALMMLSGNTLNQRAQTMVDYLAQHDVADRVALGFARGKKIGRIIISGEREYAKRSPLQHRLRGAMTESITNWDAEAVFNPRVTDHGLTLHIPLVSNDSIAGVLMLDRRGANKFSAQESERFAADGQILGALIALAHRADRDPLSRIGRYLNLVVPTSRKGRLLAGLAVVALIMIAAFPTTTRITAEAKIEGELQRALVAPMETYLDDVHVIAGQSVSAGDLLATFTTEDLSLERLKWQSERARKLKAKRDAAARQERSKLGVLDAEIAQANAEISLVESKIARRELRAPVDGIIVSGDLSQRLGAPVEKGEVLFEIVPGGQYQLAILLDEQDAKSVRVGNGGHLKLNAYPAVTLAIEILRVTPVNEVTVKGNFFVAYAAVKDLPVAIKPGMKGVSKIEVGERAAILNWTESFRRWWSLKMWQWLGWS